MAIEFHKLQIRNLYLRRGAKQICSELDAQLSNGDMLEISGDNGAGKTSLLRVIAGLTTPQNGSIIWNQHALPQAKEEYSSAMSYLGHQTGLHSQLTPNENLRFYYRLKCRPKTSSGDSAKQNKNINRRIEIALSYFAMEAFADVPCYCLSKGQIQRVGLSRLLIEPSALWLLDEPGVALDQSGIGLLEDLLSRHLKQGGVVVVSTHRRLAPAEVSAKRLMLPMTS